MKTNETTKTIAAIIKLQDQLKNLKQLEKAEAKEARWLRDLKHHKPSPIIRKIMIQIYERGFYISYSLLRYLEFWIKYKGPVSPKFYELVVRERVWRDPQTARNQLIILRRMGLVIKDNKLVIIEVKKKNRLEPINFK